MTMAQSLGAKHTCVTCQARFYDLNSKPAVCPKCQQKQPVIVKMARKGRRKGGAGDDLLANHLNALQAAAPTLVTDEVEDLDHAKDETEELEADEGDVAAAS